MYIILLEHNGEIMPILELSIVQVCKQFNTLVDVETYLHTIAIANIPNNIFKTAKKIIIVDCDNPSRSLVGDRNNG